jgi:prepilin-type N-terminal cleavage/methylation domain-containing protein
MNMRDSKGFTLMEIAVVLAIAALLVTGALTFTSKIRTIFATKAANENSEKILAILSDFALKNGRLPCPAIAGNLPSNATFGLEAPTPGTCTGTIDISTGEAFKGVLPWKTLGITGDGAFDPWDNQYEYTVTARATNLNQNTLVGMRGNLTLHNAVPVANGLPATGNQVNACSTTDGDNACNNFAVVVLVSHGPNGLGGRTRSGVATAAAESDQEKENSDTNLAFYKGDLSEGVATHFDDVVIALTPKDILAPLYKQGVKNESVSLAEKAEQIAAAVAAQAVGGGGPPYTLAAGTAVAPAVVLNCSGAAVSDSVGPIPVSLPLTALTKTDPWGSGLQYYRAVATIEASSTCLYPLTIVSAGPDRVLGNADDLRQPIPLSQIQKLMGKW